jgi:endonuclease YncB( thermonuclease family)
MTVKNVIIFLRKKRMRTSEFYSKRSRFENFSSFVNGFDASGVGFVMAILLVVGAVVVLARDHPPSPSITELAKVTEIYDGDTIVVEVTKKYRIRMLDCWAPEIRTKNTEEKEKGLQSRDFLASILKVGDEVLVETPTTRNFEDSTSLGRVLAYVWKDVDGDGKLDNVSEKMVEGGFATKENK